MGENFTSLFIREILRPLLAQWLASRNLNWFVGSNQFIYWVQGQPQFNRAPDLYIVPTSLVSANVGTIKTWVDGTPSFALEVVSTDRHKDYQSAPASYDAMGVDELIVYDPNVTARSRKRVRFQIFRRIQGVWAKVLSTNDDRVRSEILGCWFVVGLDQGIAVLRVGLDPTGEELLLTPAERAIAFERLALQERQEKEKALAAEQIVRAEKEAALRELAELKKKLGLLLGRVDRPTLLLFNVTKVYFSTPKHVYSKSTFAHDNTQ